MASTTRALILSLKSLHPPSPLPPPPFLHYHHHLPFLSSPPTSSSANAVAASSSRRRIVSCLMSGVGGGGLSDTRKSEFSREFAVIATMLKRIEPLDTSDISKGVSDSAKDSMKQTISTMLGLLPSDQFSVSVRVSKVPLHRLLVSSIITGCVFVSLAFFRNLCFVVMYTLWNAEYRMSLMRNFELPLDSSEKRDSLEVSEGPGLAGDELECEGCKACVVGVDTSEQISPQSLKDLSPEALSYIQLLEAELCSAKKELDAQKQDSVQMESNRGNSNNLLEYLRSLESDMVFELSQPSSVEVKEVMHELVQNMLLRFFKDDATPEAMGNTSNGSMKDRQVGTDDRSETITTSRDYLAKLLFWYVYAVGTSLERLGEQVAPKLCSWIVVKKTTEHRHVNLQDSKLRGSEYQKFHRKC
ncbi:hypothetical protein Cgig2_005680 [Carnegiea gigantea]|uniref:Uncharacterized protein n=1 Tax=Carnegiea gigantea TaxID=171969 RepID=A0A9Q1QIJ7_9CARY|nr:hypothetical protein Cgig2_005680 [Carnegiea gigantea]